MNPTEDPMEQLADKLSRICHGKNVSTVVGGLTSVLFAVLHNHPEKAFVVATCDFLEREAAKLRLSILN
jgi:hypothetical protein